LTLISMMPSRGLVLFLLFLHGGARRSIRINDYHGDAQQQNSMFAGGSEDSAHATKEALIPGVVGTGATPETRFDGPRAGQDEAHRAAPWFHFGPRRTKVNMQAPSVGLPSAGVGRRAVVKKTAAAVAAGVHAAGISARPVRADAGEGSMSAEDVERIAAKLTPFQRAISLQAATEPSFTGKTTNGYGYDNKKAGTYVGAISGSPVFKSSTKYESGTGWPSFYAAVPDAVIERPDPRDIADKVQQFLMGGVRTEVIDAKSGAHLGHVFPDGPPPTFKRYCMNAGAMTFVPDQ